MNSDERNLKKRTARRRPLGIPRFRVEGEPGQAIVLIALLIIVLLGIIALAIDGGGLFFLNRDAQNAADSAALAAAYAKCADGDDASMINAGLSAADHDGFDNNTTTNWVTINPDTPSENYVEAVIRATKPSYFAQVVYRGPLEVTVHAIGQCLPSFDPSAVKAIVGLGECGVCSSEIVDMTGSTQSITGGIASGCECDFNSSSTAQTTITGGVSCVEPSSATSCDDYGHSVTCNSPSSPTVLSEAPEDPLAGWITLERYDLSQNGQYALWASADARCQQVSRNIGGDDRDLYTTGTDTGCYHYLNGNLIKNSSQADDLYFEGVYYITGNVNLAEVAFGPAGATFILEDGTANWGAPFNNVTPYEPYLPVCDDTDPSYDPDNPLCNPEPGTDYLLIYTARDSFAHNSTSTAACNDMNIQFTSNVTSWNGILYSPDGGCSWSGAGTHTANGALVCYLVDLSGSTVSITWNPDLLPPFAPAVRFGLP